MSWGPSIRWMDDPITGQPIQVHGPLDAAAIYHDPSYRPGDINNMFPSYVARGHNGAILPGTLVKVHLWKVWNSILSLSITLS